MKHDQNYGMKALWAYVRSLGPLGKPSREWQGLTDEEKNAITWGNDVYKILELAEAKLKEKNT